MKKRKRHQKKLGLVAANLLILGIFWVDLIRVLSIEWSINERYRFGYLVPFIALYLFYLKWSIRPETETAKPWSIPIQICIWATALLLFPLKIIWEANPDWRMVYWIHALAVYGATLGIFALWGGKSWAKWFAPALAIFLFAVPWPMHFEQQLTQNLMGMVAAITVDFMNLLGIFAIQQGNLIQLATGWVGVEEACSGVRSFQSTIMAAYFLGEMYRYSVSLRLILLLFGAGISVTLNVARTFLLTYITYSNGGDVTKTWHDPVGYMVSLTAFLLLLGLAIAINRKRAKKPSEVAPDPSKAKIQWLSKRKSISLAVLCLLSYPASHRWYQRANSHPGVASEPLIATIDWPRASPDIVLGEIPAGIRSILRYSEGAQAHWQENDHENWVVYFFTWDEGKISSFADIHGPEVCLPSAGFELSNKADPLLWKRNGLQISLDSYTFTARGYNAHVFFAVWNDNQGEAVIPMSRTAGDRLGAAMRGEKIKGRRTLEIIITGVDSITEARAKAGEFLDRTVVVTPGNS